MNRNDIIFLCRLRIAEAELCLRDVKLANNFLSFKKEFSHILYCLKTVYELLRKDKGIEKWQKHNTDNKDVFMYVKEYRQNDLHDADHGFNLEYGLGPIKISKGAKMTFKRGFKLLIGGKDSITFEPPEDGIATGEGLFLIYNKGLESETWKAHSPNNFPWMQNISIKLPNNWSIDEFMERSLKEYKKMLWEIERLT